MTRHEKTIAWAREHLGQHEEPMGSNTGTFVRECQAATDLPGTGWPWCAAFARRAWQVAGLEVPYRGASAWGLLGYYQQNLPKWVVRPIAAKPGAFVVFTTGAGHVALLAKPIQAGDSTVTTIGGNESDSVKESVRPLTVVKGIVDPPEKTTPANVPPAASLKVFEVATSESGHRTLIYTSGANAISRKLGRILNRHGGITITRRK